MKTTLLIFLLALAAWPGAAQAAEDVIYYNPTEDGFIVDWLLSGQHRYPFAYLGASLNYDALATTGGEKSCAPLPGTKAGSGTKWEERHFKPEGNAVGLCLFRPLAYSITYAFVYVYCEQEYKDVQLLTGSDDGLLTFLNGAVVQRVQMQRGYAIDQDKAIVTLNKGWNRLFCKVDDVAGGHGLCARFKKTDGQVLKDYKLCLVRPPDGAEVRFVDGVVYEAEAAKLLKNAFKLSAETGDLAGAAAKCQEVVAAYSKAQAAAEAMYRAGTLLSKLAKTDQAMAMYADLLAKYPYSKWVEDTLMARAELLAARNDTAAAEKTLSELLASRPESNLASEALLRLAKLQTARKDFDAADKTFATVRQTYRDTVEAVIALEGLADNQKARGNAMEAVKLYKQTVDDCQRLANGKYIFFVNVQAVLTKIADSARAKLEAKDGGK